MGEGRRFKLSLLISFGIHLCLILFIPELKLASPLPPPEYVEVALIKPTPRKASPKEPIKTSQVESKKVQPKPEKIKAEPAGVKVEPKAPPS
ncbi:hypothetical protein E3J68_03095, partial [Candidatus Aerophobetes bacterium]